MFFVPAPSIRNCIKVVAQQSGAGRGYRIYSPRWTGLPIVSTRKHIRLADLLILTCVTRTIRQTVLSIPFLQMVLLFATLLSITIFVNARKVDVRQFNLDEVGGYRTDQVNLEPAPKPPFLINATSEAIEQFMAIYRTPGIAQVRKMTELDVLVGTLRSEVQQSYNSYKAESILLKLAQDERLQEIAEKTHYTIVHLQALKDTKMGTNERKARTEMMFSEFSDFVVSAVSDEMSNILDMVMRQMLRAILFTEKLTV